jgi:hypothetical protein
VLRPSCTNISLYGKIVTVLIEVMVTQSDALACCKCSRTQSVPGDGSTFE